MGFESLLPSPLPPSAGGTGSSLGVPVLQAATPAGGFALQNATPVILTWTAPNDGLLHRVMVAGSLFAVAAETGGNVNLLYTDPAGNANSVPIWAGGLTGANSPTAKFVSVKAGTTVTLQQTVALSAGGPTMVWAELWGS